MLWSCGTQHNDKIEVSEAAIFWFDRVLAWKCPLLRHFLRQPGEHLLGSVESSIHTVKLQAISSRRRFGPALHCNMGTQVLTDNSGRIPRNDGSTHCVCGAADYHWYKELHLDWVEDTSISRDLFLVRHGGAIRQWTDLQIHRRAA